MTPTDAKQVVKPFTNQRAKIRQIISDASKDAGKVLSIPDSYNKHIEYLKDPFSSDQLGLIENVFGIIYRMKFRDFSLVYYKKVVRLEPKLKIIMNEDEPTTIRYDVLIGLLQSKDEMIEIIQSFKRILLNMVEHELKTAASRTMLRKQHYYRFAPTKLPVDTQWIKLCHEFEYRGRHLERFFESSEKSVPFWEDPIGPLERSVQRSKSTLDFLIKIKSTSEQTDSKMIRLERLSSKATAIERTMTVIYSMSRSRMSEDNSFENSYLSRIGRSFIQDTLDSVNSWFGHDYNELAKLTYVFRIEQLRILTGMRNVIDYQVNGNLETIWQILFLCSNCTEDDFRRQQLKVVAPLHNKLFGDSLRKENLRYTPTLMTMFRTTMHQYVDLTGYLEIHAFLFVSTLDTIKKFYNWQDNPWIAHPEVEPNFYWLGVNQMRLSMMWDYVELVAWTEVFIDIESKRDDKHVIQFKNLIDVV